MEAVCEIAKFARIPWSKAVEVAVQKALQLKLPLVTELKRRCKLAKWKKLGWTYGLTTAELENLPKSNPKWIAKKIIRSGSPTAIDDIIEVCMYVCTYCTPTHACTHVLGLCNNCNNMIMFSNFIIMIMRMS